MSVHHGGPNIPVPQQLLDSSNVITRLEQMGRKGVAEGVTGGALGDAGSDYGVTYCALYRPRMQMVSNPLAGGPVPAGPDRRKDPLAGPIASGARKLRELLPHAEGRAGA